MRINRLNSGSISIGYAQTPNDSPLVRIVAPDDESFDYLTTLVKHNFKMHVYIEASDQRVILASDIPLETQADLRAKGFLVTDEMTVQPTAPWKLGLIFLAAFLSMGVLLWLMSR